MKRFIALLLALVVTLSLCACGVENSNNSSNTTGNNSSIEDQYVGLWCTQTKKPFCSIKFMSNGKVIWSDWFGGYGKIVTELDSAYSGEWVVEDNKIIIFYYDEQGASCTEIITIVGDGTLTWKGGIFTKTD